MTAAVVSNIAADVAALAALAALMYARATVRDGRLERRIRTLQDAAKLVEEVRAAAEAVRLDTMPANSWIGPRERLRQTLISLRVE